MSHQQALPFQKRQAAVRKTVAANTFALHLTRAKVSVAPGSSALALMAIKQLLEIRKSAQVGDV